MNRSVLLGAIFGVILAAIIMFIRGRRSTSTSSAGGDLNTRMRAIVPGMQRADVERHLGPAPGKAGEEWVYYLDKHSGYRIAFDTAGVVTQVRPWVS